MKYQGSGTWQRLEHGGELTRLSEARVAPRSEPSSLEDRAVSLNAQRFPHSPMLVSFFEFASNQTEPSSAEGEAWSPQFAGRRIAAVEGYAEFLWANRGDIRAKVPELAAVDLTLPPEKLMDELLAASPVRTLALYLKEQPPTTDSEMGNVRVMILRDFYPHCGRQFEIDFHRISWVMRGNAPPCSVSELAGNLLYDRMSLPPGETHNGWSSLVATTANKYLLGIQSFLEFVWEFTASAEWEVAQSSVRAAGDSATSLEPGTFIDNAVLHAPEPLIEEYLARSVHPTNERSILLSSLFPLLIQLGVTNFALDRYLFFTPPEAAPATRLVHDVWGWLYDRSHRKGDESDRDQHARPLTVAVARDYGVVWNKYHTFLWQEYGAKLLADAGLTLATYEGRERAEVILRELTLKDPDLRIEAYLEVLPNERARQMAKSVLVTNCYRFLSDSNRDCDFDIGAFDFRPRRAGVVISSISNDFFGYLYRRTLPVPQGVVAESRYSILVANNYAHAAYRFFCFLLASRVDPQLQGFAGTPLARFVRRVALLDEAITTFTRADLVAHIAAQKPYNAPASGTALWAILVPWLVREKHRPTLLERYEDDRPTRRPAPALGESGTAARGGGVQSKKGSSSKEGKAPRKDRAARKRGGVATGLEGGEVDASVLGAGDRAAPGAQTAHRAARLPKAVTPKPACPWEEFHTPVLDQLRVHIGVLQGGDEVARPVSGPTAREALEWSERYFYFLASQNPTTTAISPAQVDDLALNNPEERARRFVNSCRRADQLTARAVLLDFLYPYLIAHHGSNFRPGLLEGFRESRGPMEPEMRAAWVNLEQFAAKQPDSVRAMRHGGWLLTEYFDDLWRTASSRQTPGPGGVLSAEDTRSAARHLMLHDPAPVIEGTLRRVDTRDRALLIEVLRRDFYGPLLERGEVTFDVRLFSFHPLPLAAPRLPEIRRYYDQLAARVGRVGEQPTHLEAERSLVQRLEEAAWERVQARPSPPTAESACEAAQREQLLVKGEQVVEVCLSRIESERARYRARQTLFNGVLTHLHHNENATFDPARHMFCDGIEAGGRNLLLTYAEQAYATWRGNAGAVIGDSAWNDSRLGLTTLRDYVAWLRESQVQQIARQRGLSVEDALRYALTNYSEARASEYLSQLAPRFRSLQTQPLLGALARFSAKLGHEFSPGLLVLGEMRGTNPENPVVREYLQRSAASISEARLQQVGRRKEEAILWRAQAGLAFLDVVAPFLTPPVEVLSSDGTGSEAPQAHRLRHADVETYLAAFAEQVRPAHRAAIQTEVLPMLGLAGLLTFDHRASPFVPPPITAQRTPAFERAYLTLAHEAGERGELTEREGAAIKALQLYEEAVWHATREDGGTTQGSEDVAILDVREYGKAVAARLMAQAQLPDRAHFCAHLAQALEALSLTTPLSFDPLWLAFRGGDAGETPPLCVQWWQRSFKEFRDTPRACPGDATWEQCSADARCTERFLSWAQAYFVDVESGSDGAGLEVSLVDRIRSNPEACAHSAMIALELSKSERTTLIERVLPRLAAHYGFSFEVDLVGLAGFHEHPTTPVTASFYRRVISHGAKHKLTAVATRELVQHAERYFESLWQGALNERAALSKEGRATSGKAEQEILDRAIDNADRSTIEAYLSKSVQPQERERARSVIYWGVYDDRATAGHSKFDPRVELFIPLAPRGVRIPALDRYFQGLAKRFPLRGESLETGLPPTASERIRWAQRYESFLWFEFVEGDSAKRGKTQTVGLEARLMTAWFGNPSSSTEAFVTYVSASERAEARAAIRQLYAELDVIQPVAAEESARPPVASNAGDQENNERVAAASSDSPAESQEQPGFPSDNLQPTRLEITETGVASASTAVDDSSPLPGAGKGTVLNPATTGPFPLISVPIISDLFASDFTAISIEPPKLACPMTSEILVYLMSYCAPNSEDTETRALSEEGLSVLDFCGHVWREAGNVSDLPPADQPAELYRALSARMTTLLEGDLARSLKRYLRSIPFTDEERYQATRNNLLNFVGALQPRSAEYCSLYVCTDCPDSDLFAATFVMYAAREQPLRLSGTLEFPALNETQRCGYALVVAEFIEETQRQLVRRGRPAPHDASEVERALTDSPHTALREFVGERPAERVILGEYYLWLRSRGATRYQLIRPEELPAEPIQFPEFEDESVTLATEQGDESPAIALSPEHIDLRDALMRAVVHELGISLDTLREICMADVDLTRGTLALCDVEGDPDDLGEEESVQLRPHLLERFRAYMQRLRSDPTIRPLVDRAKGDEPFFFKIRSGQLSPLYPAELRVITAGSSD